MPRRKAARQDGPPPRWFKNIAPYDILWKHDTPEQRAIPPGEIADFAHLSDGEIILLIRQGYIRELQDGERPPLASRR